MLLGVDHIVIAVRELDRAIEDYKHLGFTVVPGGRHPVGTYNGLIAFADGSYIELISFYRDNPEHRWWAFLQKREGLVDFCFRTNDLLGDTAKLRRAGVNIQDPVPWSRARPWDRILDIHSGAPQLGGVSEEIIRSKAEIDEAFSFLQESPPAMLGVVSVKRYQLDVRAVGESDQTVVGADRMPSARNDGEAQMLVVLDRAIEIVNGDHDMIDAQKHVTRRRVRLLRGSGGAGSADPTKSGAA